MITKNRVYVVGGCKGGVGKSLAAMALLDFLLSKGDRPFLIETDTSNPDVYKAYKDSVEASVINLDDLDGWLVLLDRCAELTDRTIVINQGARNNLAIAKYGDRLLEGLHALDAELVTLWLINEQRDSIELLKQYTAALPGTAVHVVRNEFFAAEEKFDVYNKSKTRSEIEASGGCSLTFPSLANRVTAELYGTNRLTIDAAAATGPFGNRIEVNRWRRAVDAMFGQVIA